MFTYHTRPASLLVYLVAQKHKWKVLSVSRIGLQLKFELEPLMYLHHSSEFSLVMNAYL
jgi:hypothetical protein